MLKVYKASAGSGKTFQLVKEYLKILLVNPAGYRNILAVTFTNKATNEMKGRILKQLFLLADNRESDYLRPLQKVIPLNEENIRQRAKQALKNILHDYSRFSVSTIDSFTQRVIKAFNREMGISPNFSVGLDDELILEEATERLLAKVDTDKQIRRWLVGFSDEKIRENRSQRIQEDIKSLGTELFKEKFQMFFPGDGEENPFTRDNLEAFRVDLDKIIAWYENVLKKKGKEAVDIIGEKGLGIDDFSGKSTGPGAFFFKLANGEQPNFTAKTLTCAEDARAWYTKTNHKAEYIHQVTESLLKPLLGEVVSFHLKNFYRYQTAVEVRKQLRTLGILTDLKDEVRSLLLEKEILQLSDSNLLLNRIIGDCDSPFIYEKTGTRFNYFMLDEFQDTSALQWKNFKPLIANSLAEGFSTLLVGDVKQSIYRWRNSDWNILASQIDEDFPQYPPDQETLIHNWRSRPNIIDFNNEVIGALKETFETFLFDDIDDLEFRRKFSRIYNEFTQTSGRQSPVKTGLAQVCFLPEETYEKSSHDLLVEQVKQLQDKGFKASDIAILIRKNREGASIVEAFLEAASLEENRYYNLTVLSNESLFLYASQGVNLVMLVIGLLVDPGDKIQKVALLNLWLSWLKPQTNNEGIIQSGTRGGEQGVRPRTGDWLIDENFEEAFECELGLKIRQLRQKVLMTSLDEAVTEICAMFGLFQVKSEIPFLQTLIDQTAELKTSLSNDLSNLLLWWNNMGYKISVSVNEEVDSVRLLTVHKSKGLEFEAVILPFFNWNVSWAGNQAPLLWCCSKEEPFSRFPLLPVKATGKLSQTLFRDDYFGEKVNSFTDTLNLVYVAFTRAKSILFVNGMKPEKKSSKDDGKPGKTVNSMLLYALDQLTVTRKLDASWDEDKSRFSFGDWPVPDQKENPVSSFPVSTFHSNDFSNRIRLRLNSEGFLMSGEQNRPVKNTGKLVHEILAGIKTADDIEPVCKKAFREGRITAGEMQEISVRLKKSFQNPVVGSWFSDKVRVLNERNLLAQNTILRPDRILADGGTATVIDYKWGEKMPEKYRKQVVRYAEMLKKCGFEKVEGYLWYINQDEVEKVL